MQHSAGVVSSACCPSMVAFHDHRHYPCSSTVSENGPYGKQKSDGINKRNYENYIILSEKSDAFWEVPYNTQHGVPHQTRTAQTWSNIEQEV